MSLETADGSTVRAAKRREAVREREVVRQLRGVWTDAEGRGDAGRVEVSWGLRPPGVGDGGGGARELWGVKRHSKLTPWRHRKLTPEETAYVASQRRFRGRCRLQPRGAGSGPPHPPESWPSAASGESSWTAGTPRPGRAARPITAI